MQNIYSIVSIMKVIKCVMMFPLQTDLIWALYVGGSQIYFLLLFYEYLNLTFKLISHNIINPFNKLYFMQLKCFIIIIYVIFICPTLTTTWSASYAKNCNIHNLFSDVQITGVLNPFAIVTRKTCLYPT